MNFLERLMSGGQERRRKLDEGLGNALQYYLGPTGIPQRLNALAMLNPVEDMGQAMGDARRGDYVGSAVNSAIALAPAIGGSVAMRSGANTADDVARWLEETLAGIGVQAQGAMNAGQAFAADEFGGVGLPDRLNVKSLLRSEDGQANAVKSYLEGGFTPSEAPVRVSMTPDGKPYLVDGYHRAEWALRDGDGTVPVDYVDFDKIKILYDKERSFLPTEPAGIRAYHGSPHDFDRFSMDAIGTGEGAQAYGHGLYFAENEGVARGYRDALAPKSANVQSTLNRASGDFDAAIAETKQRIANYEAMEPSSRRDSLLNINRVKLQELEAQKAGAAPNPGRMYEVNINANPDDFLDWDAPLSAQPRVAERLGFRSRSPDAVMDEMDALISKHGDYEDMTPELKARMEALQAELNKPISNQTGERVYNFGNDLDFVSAQVTGKGPDTDRAATLREAGIPGIKYKDAGSRGMDGAEGTRNYVVFDENLIEIVRKYGIAGAAAMLGVSASDVQAAMEQGNQ